MWALEHVQVLPDMEWAVIDNFMVLPYEIKSEIFKFYINQKCKFCLSFVIYWLYTQKKKSDEK